MSRGLCYADAVKLLGEKSSATVAALDRLAGGLLLAAGVAGAPAALGLLEAKSEFAQLSQDLVKGLSDRIRGLSRFDRSQRLAAAHAVLVVAAYFEAFAMMPLPFRLSGVSLDAGTQVALATGEPVGSNRLGAVGHALLHCEVPMPSSEVPYEIALESIRAFYAEVSSRLLDFMVGLREWDELAEPERQQVVNALTDPDAGLTDPDAGLASTLLDRAIERYQEFFRRLAAGSPEVAFWANSTDHLATRLAIRRLETGLTGIEELFENVARGRAPDDRRAALARAYRAGLERPIVRTGDMPPGLRLPSLAAGYVNPRFRAAKIEPAARPAEASWWAEYPPRDDIQTFLAGYLTSPEAARSPMVVLGHPGAGKSVLTQVLAARLPPTEFLAIRVVLRDVAAESDLQTQIETAVRAATGEAISWPELTRTAGDALPVVLLDGFDELLQVTGVSQSDYLERIAQFQQRESDQGRPVAVMVTSRTAVADRARYPHGTTALVLEPFDEPQVTCWLKVWNSTNATYFASHGLTPTAIETIRAHEELSAQPLLLLLLALYDADGNALQTGDEKLGRSDLYERLLRRFTEREVVKIDAQLGNGELTARIEYELVQLALVAFAMFNRNRQWATEADLDSDLGVMLPSADEPSVRTLRAALSTGQLVVGRFFFIHEAHANQDGQIRTAYEFLHATFGEYLMARLLTRELTDMTAIAQAAATHSHHAAIPADAFLYPLLACEPLSVRSPILMFLSERLAKDLSAEERQATADLLLQILRRALDNRRDTHHADYRPLPSSAPARHASYTANLVLLVAAAMGHTTAHDLFPPPPNPIDTWRRHALLWRSQLSQEGWTSLVDTLAIQRTWDTGKPDIHISITEDPITPRRLDPYWMFQPEISDKMRGHYSWRHHDADSLIRQSQFLCDTSDDLLTHALEPLTADLAPPSRPLLATGRTGLSRPRTPSSKSGYSQASELTLTA